MDGAWRRPTDSSLRSGTPGEVPSGGARAFCLLLSGPAFRLFKSKTPSGRNPKRPLPQQWICTQSNCVACQAAFASKPAPTFGLRGCQVDRRRLEGRHRRQASSHRQHLQPTDSAPCCMNSEDAHPAQQRNPCAATSPRAEWTGRIIRSERAFVLQTILNKYAHSKYVARDRLTQPPHNFVFDQ